MSLAPPRESPLPATESPLPASEIDIRGQPLSNSFAWTGDSVAGRGDSRVSPAELDADLFGGAHVQGQKRHMQRKHRLRVVQ